MKNSSMRIALALTLPLVVTWRTAAHEVPDPSIIHNARDGVVKLYGAGGPDTAFKKVAEVFTNETGIKVEIVGGPESTWSKKAQADADILWGTKWPSVWALRAISGSFGLTRAIFPFRTSLLPTFNKPWRQSTPTPSDFI